MGLQIWHRVTVKSINLLLGHLHNLHKITNKHIFALGNLYQNMNTFKHWKNTWQPQNHLQIKDRTQVLPNNIKFHTLIMHFNNEGQNFEYTHFTENNMLIQWVFTLYRNLLPFICNRCVSF